jgi:CO/xanthine dehydrogenase Mo-binding subunit
MLFMRSLLSPHRHARIRAIDTSKAEAFPGVVAVLHRGNLPDMYRDMRIGSGPPDRFLFNEEVFEVGAPIAVVAATSDHIADEASRLIAVDDEVLPAVLDHIEGMKPGTPKQWDNKYDGTILDITPPKIRGNPDQGFSESDMVVDNVTTRSAEHHAALEPTTVIARWDYSSDGRDHLTIVGTFRHAHGARNTFSQALKLNQSQVRVITPGFVGASYGSHRDPNLVEIHAALKGQGVRDGQTGRGPDPHGGPPHVAQRLQSRHRPEPDRAHLVAGARLTIRARRAPLRERRAQQPGRRGWRPGRRARRRRAGRGAP